MLAGAVGGRVDGSLLMDDGRDTSETSDPSTINDHLSPPAEHVTDGQLTEAQRRQELVMACQSLRVGEPGGYSLRRAALELGEPIANLSRYLGDFRARGFEGLIPSISTGRTPKFNLTRAESAALKRLNLQKDSLATAVEWFAKDPACSAQTRVQIMDELDRAARAKRPPSWPISLRRAGYVSLEERMLFRGKKAFGEVEHCERRGLTWVDESGEHLPLMANSIWESDDMSSNEPFRYTCPETGAVRVGRQTLISQDVFSQHYLGVSPLGRERDAYRVEDIADHLRAVVEAHGIPLVWRLERGSWESNFVEGLAIDDGFVFGALNSIFRIVHTWKSRGKGGIESSFNHLQTQLAHESLSIGRYRSEFQDATRTYLQAQAGNPDAAAKFWDIAECADGFVKAMQTFNHRPKKRRAFGRDLQVPADLFNAAPRREVPQGEWWRFCPIKRTATVRQGHIEFSVPHYPLPFRFVVNGVQEDLYLEHGYSLLVAFHPGRPEEGCHLFNAEKGARNRDGLRMGERLFTAPLSQDTPQLNLAPHERAFAARKNANATVRAEFRAIVPAGRAAAKHSTASNQWGNRAEARTAPRPDDVDGGLLMVDGRAASAPGPARRRPSTLNPQPSPADEDAALARLEALERQNAERGSLTPA